MQSRSAWICATASVVAVLSTAAGTPHASAEPLATCSSEVVDGVEVDYCVGNPDVATAGEVPGVNVDFEFTLGFGLGR
ncbi:hypothetical protein Mycch_2238 [Mycolicibacterium chubuense NBB4]|uniref:Uncharacterized protein n=1 Tax=Mycolicibacterium chubuense (strain NBB4) TaxID=710421 RepID=I4BIA8_MYCCN|nr:hypothetical protein [Mycolicibacterium chubuense]AFM17015.1 hypothetical protein Mycch_2238 [Mycolicibacterium chubuense NBB4]